MEGFELSSLLTDLPLNLLNILILYLIVSRLVYKPVKKFMAARTERVNAEAEKAAQQSAEAEAEKQKYEALLAEGQQAAKAQLEQASAEAGKKAQAIVEEAGKKADALLDEARVRAKAEHDEALSSLRDEVADLAVGISEKLLERRITDDDNKKIVDDFFAAP